MPLPFYRIKRIKQPSPKLDVEKVQILIQNELQAYLKREELQDYLKKIEGDKERKRIWNSLSTHKKIQLLKYVLEKRDKKREK